MTLRHVFSELKSNQKKDLGGKVSKLFEILKFKMTLIFECSKNSDLQTQKEQQSLV